MHRLLDDVDHMEVLHQHVVLVEVEHVCLARGRHGARAGGFAPVVDGDDIPLVVISQATLTIIYIPTHDIFPFLS